MKLAMRNARVVALGFIGAMALASGVASGSPSPAPAMASPGALQSQMEKDMAKLGEVAAGAKTAGDLVRVACILDKQERAADVMELGTSELLIIRDPATSEQARQFAHEKLDAAAGRLLVLVDAAKNCDEDTTPEDKDDATRVESDEPETIPLKDPTAGPQSPDVPPPLDGQWPPVASAME